MLSLLKLISIFALIMYGLYIHIPFCASRCVYCGFYSTVHPEWQSRYVDCLVKELDLRKDRYPLPVSTVYLGGGTPSQLTNANLRRLFDAIGERLDVDYQHIEVTMECNPDDVTPSLFHGLPVNRVSMGVQTFSDERLRFLHRRHSADEAVRAVDILRNAGVDNISIDLMFGFPGETLADWASDIEKAISLDVEHVSAYGLMYEEGTPLYAMLRQGQVKEIDEELSLRMYDYLCDRLCNAGYEHYEISNFAKTDYRSRHNSSYWNATPYLGLGAAAHSFLGDERRWNVSDIKRYMDAVEQGRVPSEGEHLDADTHYDDMVMTALRTSDGIDLRRLDDNHRDYLLTNAQTYIKRRLLRLEGHSLRLTREGIHISNEIMSDLMDV